MRNRARRADAESRPFRRRRSWLLLAPLVLLAVAFAFIPAAASGQDGPCTAQVSTERGDPAFISVDCGQGRRIDGAEINTSQPGELDRNVGTVCEPEGPGNEEFDCQPGGTSDQTSISADFFADNNWVCGKTPGVNGSTDPPLNVEIEVSVLQDDPPGPRVTQTFDLEVSGCPSSGGGEDTDPDEDDGRVPSGGVDSGAGGTADGAPRAGLLAAAGLLLAATVVLATAGRARRTS